MELRELRLIMGRQVVVMVSVFALCVALGLAAAYLPDRTYRTSTTIILDIPSNEESLGSIAQIDFLLPALQEWAQSRTLRIRASDRVPEEFRVPRALIAATTERSVLRITATGQSPQAVQAWANAVSEQLIEERGTGSLVELVALDPAPLKRKPIEPKSVPIMVISVVFGLIAAIFAAIAADRVKQSFDTKQAVRDRLGTTVLGEIPVLRRRTERYLPIIKLLDGPHQSSDLTLAFETLRINVAFRLNEMKVDRISVVSLDRHAGKSTISAGLSCALAKVGRPVVAVEADLRRPALSDQLDVPPTHGLGDIAASGPEGEVLLHETSLPALRVLPAGIPVGRAADVIAVTLPPVIDAISEPGRTLIVDSPPLRGAPESATIISLSPHVVLVLNNSNRGLESLSDAIDQITAAGGILLGVVINRVPRRRLRKDMYPEFDERLLSLDVTESGDRGNVAKWGSPTVG